MRTALDSELQNRHSAAGDGCDQRAEDVRLMRVALLNLFLNHGGAEVCVRNLLRGLLSRGVDARLLVGRPFTDAGDLDGHVEMLGCFWPEFFLQRFLSRIIGLTDAFMPWATRALPKHQTIRNADVIHFHSLNGSYLNLWSLPKLAEQAPLVLTLHDMWPMTGDCDHSESCERFQSTCGSCPLMLRPVGLRNSVGRFDFTRWNLSTKRKVFARVPAERLVVVAPSRWLTQRAQASHLGRFRCETIPNGIDLSQFTPADRARAKHELKLPAQERILVTVAGNWLNPHKGGDQLIGLARAIADQRLGRLVVAGAMPMDWQRDLAATGAILLNGVQNSQTLRLLFSAADVMLMLSRNENYPTIVLEALACGAPVIARAVGGIPEMIDDGETGWLISPAATLNDWVSALRAQSLLGGDERRAFCSQRAAEQACLPTMIQRYEMLYRDLGSSTLWSVKLRRAG